MMSVATLSAAPSPVLRVSKWSPVSLRLCGAALLAILLVGCASPVRHAVTVFHEWPGNVEQKSFVITRKPEQSDSLEYRTYERIVRDELIVAGFVPSAEPILQVAFDYGADRKIVRYVDREPLFSPYVGFGFSRHWGAVGFSAPLWWGDAYSTTVREVDSFERRLKIEISDLRESPPRQIYEATASSRGSERALASALPLLMRAVLADFPGRSGIAREVEIMPPDDSEAGTSNAPGASSVVGKPATPPPLDSGSAPVAPNAPR